MEAISNAGSCIGVLSKEGVVLGAEKRITSKVSHSSLLVLSFCVLRTHYTPPPLESHPHLYKQTAS